jgi:hypothetical protein
MFQDHLHCQQLSSYPQDSTEQGHVLRVSENITMYVFPTDFPVFFFISTGKSATYKKKAEAKNTK